METQGRAPTLRSTEPIPATRRRIIMFPLPIQGHINPMLQLANILHTQGFKITIIHTQYNSPNRSYYPHFTFKSIPIDSSEVMNQLPKKPPSFYLKYFNDRCVDPFRNCLAGLLAKEPESVACLITDAGCYFTQAVADELKIPRVAFRTSSLGATVAYGVLIDLFEKGYFSLPKEDYETSVPEFPLLKVKDIMKITTYPQGMVEYNTNMHNQMKASSGIIWNTIKELEEPQLQILRQNFPVPIFTLGPFHKYFSASSSSLIEQDRTSISWLDNQAPKSVIYVSFGSGANITELEFQEVAHGLANTGLPFLWVVRPGIVLGSEWLELLPEKFLERVGDKGRIVKWSPQQEVLAHPATGCFWTHSGWNSTMESICEGVPMVCSPCYVDQPIIARYVCDVWKVGVLLENGLERVGIEMAIKRVMMDEEGDEIRKKIHRLKENVNLSLEKGSSYIKNLVDYILSF